MENFSNYYKKNYRSSSSFSSGLYILIIDVLALFLCIGFGFFIVNLFDRSIINFKSFVNYFLFIPFIIIIYALNGLYPGIMMPPTEQLKKISISTFLCFFAISVSLFISNIQDVSFSKIHLITNSNESAIYLALLISLLFVIVFLPCAREISKKIIQNCKWWGVPAVIYCSNSNADVIISRLLNNRSFGYHPCIIINSKATSVTETNGIPTYPPCPEVYDIIKKFNLKIAIICDYDQDLNPILTSFRYTINIVNFQNCFTYTQHLKDIGGILGFASTHNLTFKHNLIIKRMLDIFVILVASPIVVPVFLLLCILTKLTSKGPIFYGHPRIGKNGKPFKCWKFRSMCVNSQEILKEILETNPQMRAEWEKDHKFLNDPRVTKFGKFLRKSSLDELPQLINILLGQMSIIGPRPVTEEELIKYGDLKDYVLSVSPGLSGMWQVSGRSDTGYEERITLDSFYIQNWSIWLDIWILIKTIWVVLKRKGAY